MEWLDDTTKRLWAWRPDEHPLGDGKEKWFDVDPRVMLFSAYGMHTKHLIVCSKHQPSEPGWSLPGYVAPERKNDD